MKTATEFRERTAEALRLIAESKERRIDEVALSHLQPLLERIESKILLESRSGKYECFFEVPNEASQRDLCPRITSILHKAGFVAYEGDHGNFSISWRAARK